MMARYDAINEMIGMLIRRQRKAKDLTSEDIGRHAGLSRAAIINIEQGNQNITIVNLYAISDAIGVPIHAILPDQQTLQELQRINRDYHEQFEALLNQNGGGEE